MAEVDGRQSPEAKVSSAQLRKIKKPIIERRRRERINESLGQLKTLVLDALNKDESRFSKMEKADILEMTVKHLKGVHHKQQSPPAPTANRYTAGFHECAQEVKRYLSSVKNVDNEVQARLMNHLNNLGQPTANGPISQQPASAPASGMIQVQLPNATPAMALPGLPIASVANQNAGSQPVLITPTAMSSQATIISPSSIPITVPAGGLVTFVPQDRHSGPQSPGTDNANVIPLYINTAGQLTRVHVNRITPGAPVKPAQTLSCSPKAGDEAPMFNKSSEGGSPQLPERAHAVILTNAPTTTSSSPISLPSPVSSPSSSHGFPSPQAGSPPSGDSLKQPVWRPW